MALGKVIALRESHRRRGGRRKKREPPPTFDQIVDHYVQVTVQVATTFIQQQREGKKR